MSQRAAFKSKKMRADRKDKLDSIAFVWAANDKEWDSMFNKLREYKRTHGDCLVPHVYASDKKLGNWVRIQRAAFKANKIRADRKEKLHSTGFVWAVHKLEEWDSMFDRLKAYKRMHGDNKCRNIECRATHL